MTIIASHFCVKHTWEHVFLHWQQRKLQLWAGCFICWTPITNVGSRSSHTKPPSHDDVIKWKHCLRYWPFVRGIHRSHVNSPSKRPVTRSLMFSLICAWINGWVNNRKAGDLRRLRGHYDVSVMFWCVGLTENTSTTAVLSVLTTRP